MVVAIRGQGSKLQLLSKLRKLNEIEVKYSVDKNQNLWGTKRDGLEIISPMKAYVLYEKGEIQKVFINPYFRLNVIDEIMNEMHKMGYKEEDICVPNVRTIEERDITVEEIVNKQYSYQNLKHLPLLQYHIADHCNLNCKGCNHFSPLVKEKKFPDLNSVISDLEHLSKIVDYIDWIAILGGEPFLNPDWKLYAMETRKIWKYSFISIFTNGLLLNKLSENDFEFLRKWNIGITISLYKNNWGFIDDILIKIKKNGINCNVNMEDGPICEFSSSFDLKSKDDYVIKRKLCTQYCTCIRNGNITPCAPMMFVDIFNDYFHTDIPQDKALNIYEEELTFEKFKEKLARPMKICRYCNMTKIKEWENANISKPIDISSWLV